MGICESRRRNDGSAGGRLGSLGVSEFEGV
jgi:hypothetical protein